MLSVFLELYIQKPQLNKSILSIKSIMVRYKKVWFKSFKKKRPAHYLWYSKVGWVKSAWQWWAAVLAEEKGK